MPAATAQLNSPNPMTAAEQSLFEVRMLAMRPPVNRVLKVVPLRGPAPVPHASQIVPEKPAPVPFAVRNRPMGISAASAGKFKPRVVTGVTAAAVLRWAKKTNGTISGRAVADHFRINSTQAAAFLNTLVRNGSLRLAVPGVRGKSFNTYVVVETAEPKA